ncbi:MAG: hypothetical protein ACTTIC_04905 [Helicobacteraceae bacterium]
MQGNTQGKMVLGLALAAALSVFAGKAILNGVAALDLGSGQNRGQDLGSQNAQDLGADSARGGKPEIINGYVLPPEPDEKLNNSTLLGIDSNGNGIRDDVERYIIKRYAKEEFPKAKTAIALQMAWAKQKIIENPVLDSVQYQHDAIDCQWYWFNHKTKERDEQMAKIKDDKEYFKEAAAQTRWRSKHTVVSDPDLMAKIYNTRDRLMREFDFNEACNGHVFGSEEPALKHCKTDVTKFDE